MGENGTPLRHIMLQRSLSTASETKILHSQEMVARTMRSDRRVGSEMGRAIENIFPNVFRMEIPLPDSPLKSINSYLVKGEEGSLIIDTGMNRQECREAMDTYLKVLNVDLKRTDFFITHFHSDHFGLAPDLASESSRVYFGYPDSPFINTPNIWDVMISSAIRNGFPENEIVRVMEKHPGRKYRQSRPMKLTFLREGDQLSVGSYGFHCVETPGHTVGHLCLYEPQSKILFAGDHLLEGISPSVVTWDENENPLQQYLRSLDKIERLDIVRVFPGHRRVFINYRRRIAELKRHHRLRLEKILTILKKGSQNAYQIASQMKWNIHCDSWADSSAFQKWAASGEALSHLLYLSSSGIIKKERANGETFFSLC